VRYSVIAELKQLPLESMLCHPEPYWLQSVPEVEVTQTLPFQYWPEGQVCVVDETHDVPFQYCPDGQEVVPLLCWQTMFV
jgi:hypothetical protein